MGRMTRFDSATAVTKAGAGRYTVDLDSGYLIGAAMNGGYLMAVMQQAALAESAHPHAVSSSYHFLRPAGAGPAEVDVTELKSGRTVSTLQVAVKQNGAPSVIGTIATAGLDATAVPTHEDPPVDVPPLDTCRRFDPRHGQTDADGFPSRVDQYYTEEAWRRLRGRDADPVPDLRGYVAVSETDGGSPDDPCLFLPLAVDALPPVMTVFGSWRWAPTVELTWHMRAVPEPGPLVFHARAASVSDGWFDETVDLWDVKGRLVAQSRQLARSGR